MELYDTANQSTQRRSRETEGIVTRPRTGLVLHTDLENNLKLFIIAD